MNILYIYFFDSQVPTVYLNSYRVILSGFMIFSVLFSNQVFGVETASVDHLNTVQRKLLTSMQSTNEEERTQAAQDLQKMAQSNTLTSSTIEELKKLMENIDAPLYARIKSATILHYTNVYPIPFDLILTMKKQVNIDRHKLTILDLLDELLHQRLSSDSIYNIADKLMDDIEQIIFTKPDKQTTVIRRATNVLAHIFVQLFHLNFEMATKDTSINDIIDMLNDIKNDEKQSAQSRVAAEYMIQNLKKYQEKYNVISPPRQCKQAFSQ